MNSKSPFEKRFLNEKHQQTGPSNFNLLNKSNKPIGNTILPAQNVPMLKGEQDDFIYQNFPEIQDSRWISSFLISHIPLPSIGSIFPYLYCAFVAHLFFRSLVVVAIAIFAWALVTTLYAFVLRILDLPIEWPRSMPPVKESKNVSSVSVIQKKNKFVHNKNVKDWAKNTEEMSTIPSYIQVSKYSAYNIHGMSNSEEQKALTQPWYLKGHPHKYWVDFEAVFITTALWNPLMGLTGMFLSWFTVRALDLHPFNTRLVTDSGTPEINFLLIVEFLLFAAVTLKLGKNTLWLWTLVGVPIYILGFMAPINKAYTNGYDEFEPYLYWILYTLYFCIWFLRDPFGIQQILETGSASYINPKKNVMTAEPFYIIKQKQENGQKNSYYFWSIDGSYIWNAFFSVTILILVLSL